MTGPFAAPAQAWPSWLASSPEGEPPPLPGDLRLDGTGTVDVQMPKDFIESRSRARQAAKAAATPHPAMLRA